MRQRHKGGGVQVVVGDHHAQPLEGDVPDGKAHGVAEHAQEQPAQQDTSVRHSLRHRGGRLAAAGRKNFPHEHPRRRADHFGRDFRQ